MTIDPSPSLFDAPIAAPVSAVDGDDRTPLLPVRHPNQDLFICDVLDAIRSEEHTSELQSLMRISYAVFCLKKTKPNTYHTHKTEHTRIYTHSHLVKHTT